MEQEAQQNTAAQGDAQVSAGLTPLQLEAAIYAVVALVMCCVAVFVNNSPLLRSAGFFAKFFAIVLGTGLGTIGALVGNALRKAVHPDAVWTSGGFWSLLWTRIFWKWGPQTIGMVIGVLVGVAVVVK
jgi:hypothetical protein